MNPTFSSPKQTSDTFKLKKTVLWDVVPCHLVETDVLTASIKRVVISLMMEAVRTRCRKNLKSHWKWHVRYPPKFLIRVTKNMRRVTQRKQHFVTNHRVLLILRLIVSKPRRMSMDRMYKKQLCSIAAISQESRWWAFHLRCSTTEQLIGWSMCLPLLSLSLSTTSIFPSSTISN
jgi:hypothetical protein